MVSALTSYSSVLGEEMEDDEEFMFANEGKLALALYNSLIRPEQGGERLRQHGRCAAGYPFGRALRESAKKFLQRELHAL